jgi:hypothetical protein
MGGGLHKQKGPLGERALEDWRWVTAGVSQGPPSSAAQGQRAHRCAHLQQLCKVMCECGFCEHEIIINAVSSAVNIFSMSSRIVFSLAGSINPV